jgi:hypothetical protein
MEAFISRSNSVDFCEKRDGDVISRFFGAQMSSKTLLYKKFSDNLLD